MRPGGNLGGTTARLTAVLLGVCVVGCGDAEPTGPGPEAPSDLVTTTADDGPGSLRQVIAEAAPGAVIRFDTEGVFVSAQKIEVDEDLVLARDVSIVGPGADMLTVGAGNRSRVFRIDEGADVGISDLTVTEGAAPFENVDFFGTPATARFGGCILVANGSELTLDGVVVTGCVLPADVNVSAGAGIANLEGTLVVRNSRIEGNSAGFGAGVAAFAFGLTEAVTTAIEGGSVSGNEGIGLLSARGSLVVRDAAIEDNDQGVFSIRSGTVTLEDLTIERNRVGVSIGPDAKAFVRRSVVSGQAGTGISSSGSLTIEATIVSDNAGSGVALFSGSGLISGSVIAGNGTIGGGPGGTATRGGGISVIGSSTDLHVRDSARIENNQADEGGGVFMMGGGRFTIRESTISSNRANEGGGIFAESSRTVVLDGTAIVGNEARDGSGGGIYFTAFDPADLRVVNGTRVSGNSASHYGGGIALSGDGVRATIENGDVSDNLAGRWGGGIIANDASLQIRGASRVERNMAERGGGLTVGGRIEISESAVVVANRATADGGGLLVAAGSLRVDATFCVILGNQADSDGDGDGRGGGIFHWTTARLSVPSERVCLNDPDDIASG